MAFGPDLGADDYRIIESRVIATDAAISLGDLDSAEVLLEGAGDHRPGQRRHFWLAHAMRLRARLATASGETAGVEDARKGAIGLFREIEYPFWTAVTLYEQASWLLDQERGSTAAPLIAEASQIFASLGATPWLERIDALGISTARNVASVG